MTRDGVTPELHALVLARDQVCFLYRRDVHHICRDQWGRSHGPGDRTKLTVDHVHEWPGGAKGIRAPSDPQHLVAMCAGANIAGPSREVRQAERAYLAGLYLVLTTEATA